MPAPTSYNNAPLFLSRTTPSPTSSIADDELLSSSQINLRRCQIHLHRHRFELLRRRIQEGGHRGGPMDLPPCWPPVPVGSSPPPDLKQNCASLRRPLCSPSLLFVAVAAARSWQRGAWLGADGCGRRSRMTRRHPSSFSSSKRHDGCLRRP
jgi:hypothetical protein